ncbi:C40 family peptidase [Hamadaea tsunoensis]|uniref:C40 family peptidase n=1 Tax=Hamadaea tsunoensis TaxID=53368 RepID=UPI000402424C|nr:C40 family peptidase [Hamadaea tsunoensis]
MAAENMQVAVAAAGLWTAPDAVRELDGPALETPVRLRDWTYAQGPEERKQLWGRLDSQVLLGDTVLVDDVKDGWAQVVVPSQPSRKDPRGYPGWLPVTQLAAPAGTADRQVVVTMPLTSILDRPDGGIVHADVSFATILPLLETDGSWSRVGLPGGGDGWLPGRHVGAYAAGEAPAPATLIATGRKFLGLMYLAAGLTGRGLDCSGLTWVAYRRFGITLPRDATDQATVGEPVDLADLAPGDLMFFRKPDTGFVYHVGICVGVENGWPAMLHASQTDWNTIDGPITEVRREHLFAARRLR